MCWGSGTSGQLGSGALTQRNPRPTAVTGLHGAAIALAAGSAHACAVTGQGVQCWGTGRHGELGDGSLGMQATPVDVAGLPSDPGVTGLGGGNAHTCALTAGGQMFCWGRNVGGEIGLGLPMSRAAPAVVSLGCR
jgi:alpha-tubulin suppressor-like RCC1 family protein